MIRKIMVVDDSPVARKMLKASIPKDQGFEVKEAHDGQQAVDLYKEFRPDLTFMDLTMPVLTGYEALEVIKGIDSQAIVVVLTADIQPKSLSMVMELGAFTVLKKPAKKQSIADAIEKATTRLKQISES